MSIERTARRRGAFLLAAALSLASLVAVRPARAELIDRVVAVLDEEAIFLSELEARARPFLAEINANAPAGERERRRAEVLRATLDRMIDDHLVRQAAQRGHIAVTEEEVDQFIERIARERGATPQQVYDSLAGEGITRSEYRSYMEAEVLQLKVLQARVRGRINITENDLQEEYRRFVREASTRSILHPAHVFIGVPPDASSEQLVTLRQRAEDVARRARAGEDFGQLVQAYSDDEGTRATAGDLGDVNPGTLPEAIERQLNALADGEVADPIQGPNGFHVFRMISRRPITPPPFAEVRDRLYASLLNREMVRQQRIYLRELRRGAQIDNRLTPNANASAARPAEPAPAPASGE